jgi:hypothetical protein
MVVLLIINESFQTRKGMSSIKTSKLGEKNEAGCHPKQVILFRSWYVDNSQTIWWLKLLFITSVLHSDHQPPTGLSSIESHTIPQRNPVRQTQTSATLSLNALWSLCASVCFVQARADVSTPEIPPVTSLYKTDVETCGDFVMSKRNLRGVSGHIADKEVQYPVLFYNPTQLRCSAWFLQHKGRKGGECGRPKSNQYFKPSVQEEIPPKSVGPWPWRTEMIHLHIRKPMKSKNVAEKTWLCCPLSLVVQWTKIIRTTDINKSVKFTENKYHSVWRFKYSGMLHCVVVTIVPEGFKHQGQAAK